MRPLGVARALSLITAGTLQVPLNMVATNSVTAANTQLVAQTVSSSPQIVANVPGAVGDVTARFSVQVQGVERGLINATGVVSATGVFCAGAGAANSPVEFRAGTADGADSQYALFSGGGGWADPLNQPLGGDSAPGYTRGSSLYLYGNEHATLPAQSHARCATGGLYRWFVNEVEAVQMSASALTLITQALNLPSNLTVTAGTRQIIGDSSGIVINTASSTNLRVAVNGTAQQTFSVNGIQFNTAAGSVTAGTRGIYQISNGLAINVPTGGQVRSTINGTVIHNVTAASVNFAANVNLDFSSGGNNIVGAVSGGTKIGTSTLDLFSFWNKTPIAQPTTAIAGATHVGGGGTNITNTDTFGGYTLAKIAAALINMGVLA